MTTICLNMIVKNESKIITRMLKSVLPIIDTYCICDTGSTDNTIEIIQNFFNEYNIKGKIVEEPFKNFCYNRNYAMEQCYGMSDYILLMDADTILQINNFDKKILLEASAFSILQGNPDFYYENIRIVKNNEKYKYIGVTHEYLSIFDHKKKQITKDILFIKDIGDGGCKSDKYERDIKLLTEGIKMEPDNIRYYFYLANSYHDSGKYEDAINMYLKRIELGGWYQEVWYSYYRIGLCYMNLNKKESAIYYWLLGYDYYTDRIENLYEIIKYFRTNSKNNLAKKYIDICKDILKKNINKDEYLFLHNDIYTYKIDYEYSIIAYYVGIKNINNEIINILNHSNDSNIVSLLLSNMKFYKYILKPNNIYDLSDSFIKKIDGKNIKFNSSSASILPYNDGYCMNIRYVNYIYNDKYEYEYDKSIITLNKYIELDKNFKNTDTIRIFTEDNFERTYTGIEDIRLFNYNNQLIYIGTGLHQNNKIGIVYGNYDTDAFKLIPNELKSSFSNKDCEKNWVYLKYKNELCIIYQWNPLYICKINNNTIDLFETKTNLPKIFNNVRGSTCGYNFNNEIWFIVHIVSYEKPRYYYHMFVIFDDNMNLLKYSAPFQFEGSNIEYCIGLIVEDNNVIVSYSVLDRQTKIAIYDKHYIDNIIKYKNLYN